MIIDRNIPPEPAETEGGYQTLTKKISVIDQIFEMTQESSP